MNFEELDHIRGVSLGNYNFTPKDSKACAGAMRALQEKLKDLESENIDLKDKLIVLENRANNDREKWQTRLMEEVQLSKEKEAILCSKLQDREDELEKVQLRVCTLEEQVKIKETQVKYAEKDSVRLMEQFKLDVESLHIQIELMQKALHEKSSENKSSSTVLERLEREKNLIAEELKQEKRINSSLQSEVNFLRENHENQRSSLQKNLESLESELNKQCLELGSKVKELEIKNKSLRELNSNQARQIEHLRKEISEMSKGKVENKTEKPKGNESSKRIPAKPARVARSRSPEKKPVLKKEKSFNILEKKDTEDDVRKMIEESERELDKLNQRYKTLLSLSYKESSDLSTIRKDMGKLAEEIDQRSEDLYDLKKKQQEFLRAKLLG